MPRISAKQKDQVRSRLLETAAKAFAEKGLEGANIDEIAVGAGFAKGTVYNYFKSKQALFGAVLAEACRKSVESIAGFEHTGSARERLLALAVADLELLRENEEFFKVVNRELQSFRPETYQLIVENIAPYIFEVLKVIQHGVTTGEIRSDIPAPQLALAFVGEMGLLYAQHWGSGGEWPKLDEVPEFVVTIFLDGAGHPAPGPEDTSA